MFIILFAMAMRDVHFAWNGLRDYGFLRLCKKWIEEKEETVMTPEAVMAMIKTILPEEMCKTLDEELVDLEGINVYHERTQAGYSHEEVMASILARGRDNARTPMQWTCGENAGFTTGTPWFYVNENYKQVNLFLSKNILYFIS